MFWVLIETVRLSTHNICFGWEIKKIEYQYALLSGDLIWHMGKYQNFGYWPVYSIHPIIFTFPLRVFKWTFTFEMWFIPSWTNRFKPHPHTRHLSGLTSRPSNNVTCLLTFAWRWTRITMTLSAEIWRFGYSEPYADMLRLTDLPCH